MDVLHGMAWGPLLSYTVYRWLVFDKVLFCGPEEPGTYYAAQSDLKLTAIPLPHRFNAEHTTPNPTHKMEEAASQSLEEDFEGQATHTGPKGVINDWRKFKLESEDGDSIPPSKKEILRQMSSPQSRDDSKERMSRKMSIQEYELIHQDKEDESCLRKYRRQCMQDMHQKLSFGPRYGFVYELETGEQFLETIEKEQKVTTIVVNIYEDGVRGCDALNSSLACLAVEYPMVKFCKIKASNTGAGDRFSTDVLPTLLVYKGGELISNFISVAEQFAEEFFAVDVESFLNEYGLLPEREIHDLEQTNMEDEDIE